MGFGVPIGYDSKADFHIIMSSIQVWSNEHGFETWGNFPHEVDKN